MAVTTNKTKLSLLAATTTIRHPSSSEHLTFWYAYLNDLWKVGPLPMMMMMIHIDHTSTKQLAHKLTWITIHFSIYIFKEKYFMKPKDK
jgi:hypothetical protein